MCQTGCDLPFLELLIREAHSDSKVVAYAALRCKPRLSLDWSSPDNSAGIMIASQPLRHKKLGMLYWRADHV